MPQTVSGVKVKDAGGAGAAMDMTVEMAATKLKNIINTGPAGTLVCGLGEGEVGEGALTGNLTVTGTTNVGAAAGVTII